MDLESRKISFIQEFLRLQNEEIIGGLEDFLRKKKAEAFDEVQSPMSEKEFNNQIDLAMRDSENGRMTKASELKKRFEG